MATEIKPWNPLTHIQAPFAWREPGWVRIEDDVFAPDVKDGDIDRVLGVVALCPRLNFIMPTAHTERMADLLRNRRTKFLVHSAAKGLHKNHSSTPWPLPNLILGAIVEDQATADARIPNLLRCPAKLRMVDARLRGKVDVSQWISPGATLNKSRPSNWAIMTERQRESAAMLAARHTYMARCEIGFSWITCRGTNVPVHPDWVRSLRDQCAASGVPFAFLGWGDYVPWDRRHTTTEQANAIMASDKFELRTRMMPDGSFPKGECTQEEMDRYMSVGVHMVRVGPELSGRLLDGVEHDAMPEVGHD